LGLALDEPKVEEIPNQVNGFEILIAEGVKNYAYGSLVDYQISPYYEGFVINTGNSGC
jgi:Fe-S cluster assembly iron-binding protein IscA